LILGRFKTHIEEEKMKVKMFIGGEWVDSSSGETFEDHNPFDGSLFAVVPKGDERDAARAIEAAHRAKDRWADLAPAERIQYLFKLLEVLERRGDEVVEVLVKESGSVVKKAGFEVFFTKGMIQDAIAEAKRVSGETLVSDVGKFSFYIRQPVGVVVAISPWNFPFLLSMKKVLYALVLGNTVVLKPSSDTPVVGIKIAELFEEVGLPPGVLNVVTGPGSAVGEALVTHPKVSHITLTGDAATGRRVAELAARGLKGVTLELGGNDPLIVLEDADLEQAVDAAVFGAFFHQGQICMSSKRIILEKGIAEEFTSRFVQRVKGLKVGDPSSPETDIGPVINQAQLLEVHDQVTDALNKGAKLLCGGTYNGLLYEPTVLTDVTEEMRIFKEEVFGPARPIIVAEDADQAVRIANNSIYGLSAGIITRDVPKAIEMAKRLECGMVHINDSSVHDEPHAPFGGVKSSGIGREGGKFSMAELTEIKWVTIQPFRRHYPI